MKTFSLACHCMLPVMVCIGVACQEKKDPEEKIINPPTVRIDVPFGLTTSGFSMKVIVDGAGGGTVSDCGLCFAQDAVPTIDDVLASAGSGMGTFTATVSNLPSGTLFYVRGFATNEKGTSYSNQQFAVVTSYGTVTDFEGNTYGTVSIGEQEWMRENLRSSKYADGSEIPRAVPAGNDEANVAVYGRLYDWYAVMHGEAPDSSNPSKVRGVCPDGFHVPSDKEWQELESFLGMAEEDLEWEGYRGTIAGKLKAAWQWYPTPEIADNTTGFTALPAGYQELNGDIYFSDFFWAAFYISSVAVDTSKVTARLMTGDSNGIWRVPDSKLYKMSMRCVRDK